MDETKKTRGAWVIYVREINPGRGAGAEYGECSSLPSEDIHHDEEKSTASEKEE